MPKTNVAIYARFSTTKQDARSIEDQERRCRRFAEERGWHTFEVFSDAAQSGSHLDRASMQRLLAAARARPPAFQAVLVDDLSRLSRDLGGLWRTVFEDLAGAGVRVIDCTTGRASDERGARLTFGVTALMNDAFLEMVRTETHRGLEGRAIAGFHTGGRVFGYRTVPEPDPADPLHARAVLTVDENEAALVRRIFAAFAAGESLRAIASAFNREGVPAPYDRGRYTKPAGRGWSHTTIRAMLRNERYVGRVTWNRRQWKRHPTTRKRVYEQRPISDVVVKELPALAIVPLDLWDRVQARLGEPKLGTPVTRNPSPVSGLLRCGVCGSRMSIAGQRTKGDVTYRAFACSANRSKGPEVCPNRVQISERKAIAALVATVRWSLAHPRFRDRFEATFQRLWAAAEEPALPADDGEIRGLEAKLARLVAVVEDGHGDVAALTGRMRELEAQIRDARARRAAAAPRRPTVAPPDAERLLAAFEDLEGTLAASPARAREALAARFEPVVLTPKADGSGYGPRTALK